MALVDGIVSGRFLFQLPTPDECLGGAQIRKTMDGDDQDQAARTCCS
jgi:hypothetical protein